MEDHPDFKELLQRLSVHEVEFLIVGDLCQGMSLLVPECT
jgi:hypothetical protein